METLRKHIPSPIIASHAEALSLAIHCFMLEKGYKLYVPKFAPGLNSMGLPSNFNASPNEWSFLYTHPSYANYFSMACGVWGPKMLVVMEEYVKLNTNDDQYVHRSSYQFGVGQENYAHEEDLESLDKIGKFGWDILANVDRLQELTIEMMANFEEKLEALSSSSERESSESSSSSSDTPKLQAVTPILPGAGNIIVASLVVAIGALILFRMMSSRK